MGILAVCLKSSVWHGVLALMAERQLVPDWVIIPFFSSGEASSW